MPRWYFTLEFIMKSPVLYSHLQQYVIIIYIKNLPNHCAWFLSNLGAIGIAPTTLEKEPQDVGVWRIDDVM